MSDLRLRRALALVLAICSAASAAWAGAAEPQRPETKPEDELQFVRVPRDANGDPVALEVSILRFRGTRPGQQDVTVDLVGAIHIGDKAYYDELNRRFRDYDAVLYELVAPEGTRIPREGRPANAHPVGMLQTSMKSLLELSYQLDEIDYTVPNLVHADMSPEQFARTMEQRGESVWQMVFSALGQSAALQGKDPAKTRDARLLSAFFSSNRALALKRAFAEQFEDLEAQLLAFNGPDGSTIVTERNKRALEVLQQQLKAGKKNLAIFYGAGHFPDMAQRLENEFQMEVTEVQWLTAWSLKE